MPRPRKFRKVCCMPRNECFGPIGNDDSSNRESVSMSPVDCQILMSVDEYETIRLVDLEGCTQEECAKQMGIARTTVQGIYNDARKKIADALVNGRKLIITGGDYMLCENFEKGCGYGCKKKCHHGCHSEIMP